LHTLHLISANFVMCFISLLKDFLGQLQDFLGQLQAMIKNAAGDKFSLEKTMYLQRLVQMLMVPLPVHIGEEMDNALRDQDLDPEQVEGQNYAEKLLASGHKLERLPSLFATTSWPAQWSCKLE
jgi:hypothetical protein